MAYVTTLMVLAMKVSEDNDDYTVQNSNWTYKQQISKGKCTIDAVFLKGSCELIW